MSFTHLNVASAFSGHFGVTRPELLAEAAAARAERALAITDRNGLYGAVKHIGACLKLGLKPIVGVSLNILSETDETLARCVILAHGGDGGIGWAALCRLVSAANTTKRKEAGIRLTELAKHINRDGLTVATVLLGPDSNFGRATLTENRTEAAGVLIQWLRALPGRGALAIEIATHLTEPGSQYSLTQARRMLALADNLGVPAILTNAVRYLEPDDALTADVLDAARFLEPLGNFELQPNAQGWLKPAKLMHAIALEVAEDRVRAKKLLDTTELLAQKCELNPEKDCGWGKPKTPEKALLGIDGNPFEVLWQKAHAAIDWRYPNAKEKKLLDVKHRLSKELITINQLGFATYFLTVADVAQMIRDMKIRIAARGSGAGSLTNYLLGISGVDPIEHNLLFERFLSTERSSLPDIDIDVESARRHDIYRAIFKRYGSQRVTLLSMQSTYRGRGAMRDSGLALGLDDDEIDEIAKNMWRFSARTFRAATETKPELSKLSAALESDRKMNLLVDITERLDRLPRHISMHPCGVILGDGSLLDLTPVETSGMGLPMSQYDKDDMDPMGMLKLDVLGVRMQSAMAYAIREIEKTQNRHIELDEIPKDDAKTFELIRTTNTLGIFQIESPGQRELTGKHQPTEFNDLTIQISLFRPGPMKGNMIAPYLDGRHGFAKAEYLHPDLKPILQETFGVVIFHEHVLRIFDRMTGCGLAKADEFRRSLENPRVAQSVERYFKTQANVRGYDRETVEKVWAILAGFSSFGFCKAHGAAFALPTYQSAWLKTHYPTEFLAGLLTHDPGMYPRRLLLAEARRLGVKVLPIDVNRSTNEFLVQAAPKLTTDPNEPFYGVRMALTDVKAITEPEVQRIVEEQPFQDIADFYVRAKPSRRTLQNLALVGALDELARVSGHHRGDIMQRVKELNLLKARPKDDPNQFSFDFELKEYLQNTEDLSREEKLQAELSILQMDVTEHQIEQYRPMLDAMGVINSNELVGLRNKSEALIAGVRIATQTPPMRSGKRVVFVSLDDGHGVADATFFDEAQARASQILFNNRLLLIAGKTRRTGVNGVSLMAENAWDLKALWNQWLKEQKAS